MQDYPPQYNTLIDDETWAFIRATEIHYPPDAASCSVAEQRLVYNRMCAAFNTPHPPGISTSDCTLKLPAAASPHNLQDKQAIAQNHGNSVAQRLYLNPQAPSETLVLYFHGGGFVVGDLESHDGVCADIAALSGLNVLATDYRLLPENASLAAYHDCWAAFVAASERYNRIVLCGDSAGGNLCAAVAHTDRNRRITDAATTNVIQGQVLIYPGLGATVDTNSARTHSHAPMLTLDDIEFYESLRQSRRSADFRLSPLSDDNYQNLPPTICISAECDPLADDGMLYCDQIAAAGGSATYYREKGLVHGYLRARHSVNRAAKSFDRICQSLKSMAS